MHYPAKLGILLRTSTAGNSLPPPIEPSTEEDNLREVIVSVDSCVEDMKITVDVNVVCSGFGLMGCQRPRADCLVNGQLYDHR